MPDEDVFDEDAWAEGYDAGMFDGEQAMRDILRDEITLADIFRRLLIQTGGGIGWDREIGHFLVLDRSKIELTLDEEKLIEQIWIEEEGGE